MSTVTLDTHKRRLDTLTRDVHDYAESGHDVILRVGDSVPPERILKILSATAGDYKIDITIRHAELREYIEHALAGAATGAFLTGAAAILIALTTGNPIPLYKLLIIIGAGSVIGGLIGLGSTPVSECILYKTSGETRIKFISNGA